MSKQLPPLLILSDDARGFSIESQLARWPHDVAFIERSFGYDIALTDHRNRNLLRLATCSPREARNAKLSGVHWPQKRLKHRFASKTSGLIETTSVHTGLALAKAARLGLDAILVSTAFASQSPSATKPLGAIRLAMLQRMFPKARIYALGGINLKTALSLTRTQIYGVALVSYAEN